jgi:hypothetical protein
MAKLEDTVGSVKGRRYQGCAYNNTSNNYPTAPSNNDDYYYYKTMVLLSKIKDKNKDWLERVYCNPMKLKAD